MLSLCDLVEVRRKFLNKPPKLLPVDHNVKLGLAVKSFVWFCEPTSVKPTGQLLPFWTWSPINQKLVAGQRLFKRVGFNQLYVESPLPVVAIIVQRALSVVWSSVRPTGNLSPVCNRSTRVTVMWGLIPWPGVRSCSISQVLSIRTSCCSLRLLWIHPVLLAIRVRSIKPVGNDESQTDGGHAGSAHQTGDWRMGKLVSGIVTAGAWGAVSLPSPREALKNWPL